MVDRKGKLLKKFRNSPSSVSIQELIFFLSYKGYKMDRIKGSHFIFEKAMQIPIIVPSHNGKVDKVYIKKILKQLKCTK